MEAPPGPPSSVDISGLFQDDFPINLDDIFIAADPSPADTIVPVVVRMQDLVALLDSRRPLVLDSMTDIQIKCRMPLITSEASSAVTLRRTGSSGLPPSQDPDVYTCSGVLDGMSHYRATAEPARRNIHLTLDEHSSWQHASNETRMRWQQYPEGFRHHILPLLDEPLQWLGRYDKLVDTVTQAILQRKSATLLQLVLQGILRSHELERHPEASATIAELVRAKGGWIEVRRQYQIWETAYIHRGTLEVPSKTPHLQLWQQVGVISPDDYQLRYAEFSNRRLQHILQQLAGTVHTVHAQDAPPPEATEDPYEQLVRLLEQHEVLVLNNCLGCWDKLLVDQISEDARWVFGPGSIAPAAQEDEMAAQKLPLVVIRRVHLMTPGELSEALGAIYSRTMTADTSSMLPKLLIEGDFLTATFTCGDVRACLQREWPQCFVRLTLPAAMQARPPLGYSLWRQSETTGHDSCPVMDLLMDQLRTGGMEVVPELPIQCEDVRQIDHVSAWRTCKSVGVVMSDERIYTRWELYALWSLHSKLYLQAQSVQHVYNMPPFSAYHNY